MPTKTSAFRLDAAVLRDLDNIAAWLTAYTGMECNRTDAIRHAAKIISGRPTRPEPKKKLPKTKEGAA